MKIIINGISMLPTLKPDQKYNIKQCPNGIYNIGDIIVFKRGENYICHRIIDIINTKKEVFYITKGDNNLKTDENLVNKINVIGKIDNVL